ncbi:hypothetical protein Scep_027020 [Stephania cephalantha]|uniref:Uncharacterized protein n=1 Tax=Stephania cephalantha TaxID=152367 RepID=A0AAP0HT46_9MAGN
MAEDEDSSSSMASLFEGMVLFNSSQIPDPIDTSPTSTSTPLDENLFSRSHSHLPISPIAPRHGCRCCIDNSAAARDPIWVPTELEEEEERRVLQ